MKFLNRRKHEKPGICLIFEMKTQQPRRNRETWSGFLTCAAILRIRAGAAGF